MKIRSFLFTLTLSAAPLHTYGQADENAAAEVLSKTGDGDWRESITQPWSAASVEQQLMEGSHIRTGSRSKENRGHSSDS